MLYCHGFIDSAEGEKAQLIVNAYNKNGRYNILLPDWRELAAGFYSFVVFDLPTLGKEVATQILLMGILGRLHFVGHSLGGQLGGHVGKEIISQSGGTKKLKRISALDPAGPGFVSIGELTKRLTKNDAEFVDVIHTNAGALGYPDNTGTVDFYPNGGRTPQPGCGSDDNSCAHQRAVYLWAESVEKGSAVSFLSNSPNGGPRIQIGNNCPLSV
ncbi:Phospholipase A1 VesT1.02 [Pseudolycoriella hygida]|uniref:Phospholipase A1 VesT1.02 n=1 Tax=Pseudolycoriella hygida TaxID=35572 RepID=A0A9Q0MS93_9DIPT|nr:Phospholipase A1 VesT1.02 [Pseudolycoriella hygida]